MAGITCKTVYIPRTYVELESEDGILRYEYNPSREYAAKRLRETKEISLDLPQMLPIYAALSRIGNAKIVGALWNCFGPPQDIYDDWKQSYSFFFDLIIQCQLMDDQFEDSVYLLMEVCDWKGGPDIRLRMPRKDEDDWVIEDGKDLLTEQMRNYSLFYFIGFIEGYARTGPLHDFERTYPYGKYTGKKYGVRNGIPFDETYQQCESDSE